MAGILIFNIFNKIIHTKIMNYLGLHNGARDDIINVLTIIYVFSI